MEQVFQQTITCSNLSNYHLINVQKLFKVSRNDTKTVTINGVVLVSLLLTLNTVSRLV